MRGRSIRKSRRCCSRRRRRAGARSRSTPILRGFVQGHEPVLRQAFEAARLGSDPALLPDEDRARRRPPRAGLAGRARAEERRARRGGARLRGAHGRLRRPLGLPPPAARGLAEPIRPTRTATTRRSGGSSRTGTSWRRSRSTGGTSRAIRSSAGSRCSACGRAGASAGSGRRCCGTRSATSATRGATRVGLGVDGESTTGAVRLYESVGMRQVRRSDTYEKTL